MYLKGKLRMVKFFEGKEQHNYDGEASLIRRLYRQRYQSYNQTGYYLFNAVVSRALTVSAVTSHTHESHPERALQ